MSGSEIVRTRARPRGLDGAGEDAERLQPLPGGALGLGVVGRLALEQLERGLQAADLVGELSPFWSTPAKMRTSSSSRRFSRPSSEVSWNSAMIAKPSAPASTMPSTLARVGEFGEPARAPIDARPAAGCRPGRGRCAAPDRTRPGTGGRRRGRAPHRATPEVVCPGARHPAGPPGGPGPPAARTGRAGRRSCVEEVAADRGDVGEVRTPSTTTTPVEELAADTELVTEEDDERRHDHVGEERHDEDLVVEDAVEDGPDAAEDRVEGGDDGDGEVGLQPPGTAGWRSSPMMMPRESPMAGITGSSSGRGAGRRVRPCHPASRWPHQYPRCARTAWSGPPPPAR